MGMALHVGSVSKSKDSVVIGVVKGEGSGADQRECKHRERTGHI